MRANGFELSEIFVAANYIFSELSASQLSHPIQASIRSGLTETLTKGVIVGILRLRGARFVNHFGVYSSDGTELIQKMIKHEPSLSEPARAALEHCRNEILREISDRISNAVTTSAL